MTTIFTINPKLKQAMEIVSERSRAKRSAAQAMTPEQKLRKKLMDQEREARRREENLAQRALVESRRG